MRWGMTGKPLVPDEATAKKIFLAVEASFTSVDLEQLPRVGVRSSGDTWTVYRGPPLVDPPIEGGEGIAMQIAKCDATISNVYFQR
jgi:hypothetical protein